MLDASFFNNLTEEEKLELAEIWEDPVLFATVVLDEEPRWYQKKMIRDDALKKVYRTGRRAGKCVHKDSRIINPVTGEWQTAEHIFNGLQSIRKHKPLTVSSIDNDGNLTEAMASIFDNGVQECFIVKTKSGRSTRLTGNHPLLAKLQDEEAWIEVDDVEPGMFIAVPGTLPYFGSQNMDQERLKFLAYMVSNGIVHNNQIRFKTANKRIMKDFLSSVASFSDQIEELEHEAILIRTGEINTARAFLESHGLMWIGSRQKFIPQQVFSLSKDNLSLFLHHLLSCEGTYTETGFIRIRGKKVKKNSILYHTVSEQLAQDIQHLLLRFGISASVSYLDKHSVFAVEISGSSNMSLFCKEIGMFAHSADLKKLKMPKGEASSPPIIWDEVILKESIGEHQTYDLSVPDIHNFVCDDIFVHNTWSMALEALHFAFTTPEKKILISAPYESQVNVIFKEIRRFIRKSPFVSSAVARDVKSPHTIEFTNGSEIFGYTSGTRSGASGDSMRGLDADRIFLDEVDRMSPDDIDSIMAIRYTDPLNRKVRTASTPTGRRSFFYDWCTKPELGWSQHHYPSSVNPSWKEITDAETGRTLEDELRAELSESGWVFEVEAEFGPETSGVFNKEYIDRARKKYKYYSDSTPIENKTIRVMGIDWDKETKELYLNSYWMLHFTCPENTRSFSKL